jgi:hypothetical protein
MITEPVTPLQVKGLKVALGFGAIVLNFDDIDYTRGRGILTGKHDRCLWTREGFRISIIVASDGGIIASQSKEVDPELPPPSYPDVNPNMFKCINPDCNVMVDGSKRKSGACCKDHMNYECTHPDCVLRAQTNGWSRPTHPHGTKIGKTHIHWRKQ